MSEQLMATEPTVRRAVVDRPYYYATSMEKTVHAYTRDEWGIGGSQPSGNYSVHTTTGLYIVTILMTIPAIFAPLLLIIAVASLNIIVGLLALVCTVLFTGGWLFGIGNLRRERQASKQRRLKGLPKPRFALSDDHARDWFESHPSGIAITRENFPDSTRPFPGETFP
ncbi:hypothetical protein [Arthrobacter sp. ISL-72]|uniref:hypothetical protein n=1 Tax=Arthrobacter sp. ISL-72 TaxID=2819114 RepID=UPI001BE8ADAE|nr:hypothetical protein [Arthrobacter sp. ISL-72]MBT2594520.1 hypothetical protein [Arthrobacter sp. ISL-72]